MGFIIHLALINKEEHLAQKNSPALNNYTLPKMEGTVYPYKLGLILTKCFLLLVYLLLQAVLRHNYSCSELLANFTCISQGLGYFKGLSKYITEDDKVE